VSVKKSSGQRHGVGRVAHLPQRQPRQVRQRARAPWAVGRFYMGRSARGSRGTGAERDGYDVLKLQPPTWRCVGEEEPRPTAWSGARRTLAAKTTTPSPTARACSVGRWFSTGRSARGSRGTGVKRSDNDVPKPQPPTWGDFGEEALRPTAWGGARRALAAKTTTPSPTARARSVGRWPVLHGAKRARAVRHGSQTR